MTAYEVFEQTYKKPPMAVAFTPYRICPIGAHSDHQLGKITGYWCEGRYLKFRKTFLFKVVQKFKKNMRVQSNEKSL